MSSLLQALGLCPQVKQYVSHKSFFILYSVLYTGNAVGQLYLMNEIIGKGYTAYGYNVLVSAINGEEWTESPFFPRVTQCYFKVREKPGNNISEFMTNRRFFFKL